MGLLRSEDMKHGTLVLPVDQARTFLNIIGFHANIQFEDMNALDMHRPWKKYIQRIDEMERKIRFLQEEMVKQLGWQEEGTKTAKVGAFLKDGEDGYTLDEIEAELNKLYAEFVAVHDSMVSLAATRDKILDAVFVAETAASLGGGSSSNNSSISSCRRRHNSTSSSSSTASMPPTALPLAEETARAFASKAGVILQSEQDRFARALFRATRGNSFVHFSRIAMPFAADDHSAKRSPKSVFVVFYPNAQALGTIGGESALSRKISQICKTFSLDLHPWFERVEDAKAASAQHIQHLREQEQLLEQLRKHLRSGVMNLIQRTSPGGNTLIEDWRLFCVKEKGLNATLNLFAGRTNLRASCWFPAEEEENIKQLLREACGQTGARAMLLPHGSLPHTPAPTYIRSNGLTEIAQQLVDTYGYPRYKEVNPAIFTVVTFPFLFGIMFGDVGHGAFLLMLGLCIVWLPEELQKKAPSIYSFRYMLTMMGFFATYVGFLYNDFFSVGLCLFRSRWEQDVACLQEGIGPCQLQPQSWFDLGNSGDGLGPYPFGLDPAWRVAANELVFVNSLKMKMSVIVGVAHMIGGLALRWCNAIYEYDFVEFFGECIPMMIFMFCTFGFMDFMILYKWVTPLDTPPSIIHSLIAMAFGVEDKAAMFGEQLPRRLVYVVVVTVPWMLLFKPCVLWFGHRSRANERQREQMFGYRSAAQENGSTLPIVQHGLNSKPLSKPTFEDEEKQSIEDKEEEFNLGEVMMHQAIETIEFVLGAVSHTASYLRLWALSLAHQQLSSVFFQKTLLLAMQCGFPWNVIPIYIAFVVWLALTVAILLLMDALECFLHTLRLHWVEFQSKFYKADGQKFRPFRHETNLDEAAASAR